ncbi:MAG: extracellular solute-binding protein [Treponema socranskii subsp. buccale]
MFRKKILGVCLQAAVIFGLSLPLSAMGNVDTAGGGTNGQKVKISVWHSFVGADQRAEFMAKRMADFKAANPDIEVDEQKIPRDQYQTKLKTLAAAGELPDGFLIWPNSMTREFSSAGLLADINDLLESNKEWRDSLLPRALEEFTFNGKTYSAGLGVSLTSELFYNKALFNKYNVKVPTTWEELKTAVEVFKKNGIIPMTLGNKAKWPAQSEIFSVVANRWTGSEWLNNVLAGKNAKFTDSQFISALDTMKQLADMGAFNKDYNSIDDVQMRNYFYRSEAAMMIQGSWVLPDIIKNTPADFKANIGITVFPSFRGGKGDPSVMTGVSSTGIAINKKTTLAQKAALKKLIVFLTNADAQAMYTQYYIPVSARSVRLDISSVDTLYAQTVELMKAHPLVTVYDSALNSEQTEIINNGLQGIMLRTMQPMDVAKQLQATIR